MTKEKAVKMLEYIRHTGNGESEYKNYAQSTAIDIAIDALKQESVLDKIRVEIEALPNKNYRNSDNMVYRDEVLALIDGYRAYRAESESKE